MRIYDLGFMNIDARKQKIVSFTDLVVWQKGHTFVVALYQVTKDFSESANIVHALLHGLIKKSKEISASSTTTFIHPKS